MAELSAFRAAHGSCWCMARIHSRLRGGDHVALRSAAPWKFFLGWTADGTGQPILASALDERAFAAGHTHCWKTECELVVCFIGPSHDDTHASNLALQWQGVAPEHLSVVQGGVVSAVKTTAGEWTVATIVLSPSQPFTGQAPKFSATSGPLGAGPPVARKGRRTGLEVFTRWPANAHSTPRSGGVAFVEQVVDHHAIGRLASSRHVLCITKNQSEGFSGVRPEVCLPWISS
jgi:hypothetical protein